MNTWDVVILRATFADASGAKMRPAIVVSKNEYHNAYADGIFLLVTSNVERQAQYDILIPESHPEFRRTGLSKSSAIRVDKMMFLNRSLVCRVLGSLGEGLKAEVRLKLADLWQI
jgi:mRNA-degrading endonuclease toxin of MazEF toxin-antitoxin module